MDLGSLHFRFRLGTCKHQIPLPLITTKHMLFTELPTELQLNILSQTHCPRHIARSTDALTQYIQRQKLAYYLDKHPLLVSLYSSSSKDTHRKVFYEASVSSLSPEHAVITLGQMHHKESLIKITHFKDTYQNQSHLDLSMNDEQSSSKIFVTITDSKTMRPLLEHSCYIQEGDNKLSTALPTSSSAAKLQIQLTKGDMEPPKEGTYDWHDEYNYALDFKEIKICQRELVRLFEKEECLIVRY